jgi:transposase
MLLSLGGHSYEIVKTHLQHLMIATVINLIPVLAWVDQTPLAKTRISRFGALALAA